MTSEQADNGAAQPETEKHDEEVVSPEEKKANVGKDEKAAEGEAEKKTPIWHHFVGIGLVLLCSVILQGGCKSLLKS